MLPPNEALQGTRLDRRAPKLSRYRAKRSLAYLAG
jgi:hypothetical protein